MKKRICLLLSLLMVFSLLAGCQTGVEQKKEFTTFEDFENARLGVLTGSEFDKQTQELFPKGEKLQFADVANLILSLESDKTDGFLLDSTYYSAIAWEKQGYTAIKSDKTTPVNMAFMLSDSSMAKQIRGELDEFITQMHSNGGIDALAKKWFSGVKPTEYEDYRALDGENGTITVAAAFSDMPLSFVYEDLATGFDVELMVAFAKAYGYKLDIVPLDFAAKLGGIAANKYDVAIGGITVTDERREEMNFTVSYYESPVYMVTKGEDDTKTLADYQNSNVGITTGTYAATIIDEVFPEATIKEFSSITDMVLALSQGKIDIVLSDVSYYTCLKWDGMNIDRLEEPYTTTNFGVAFKKGENAELREQMNAFISKIKANGEYERLQSKWFGEKEPSEFSDPSMLTGGNGTLKVVTNNEAKPFGYIKNGELVGYDVDFIVAFAEEYGYKLEISEVAFPSVLAGLQAGMYDLAISGFSITEERMETVDFSEPYHMEDMVFLIKGSNVSSLDQFNASALGVVSGSPYGVFSEAQFPNAEIEEFDSYSDVLLALKEGKIDGIMLDKPVFSSAARTDEKLSSIPVPGRTVDLGFAFNKNDTALKAQMDEFIAKLQAEGKMEELIAKWCGEAEPAESIPLDELAVNEKPLNLAIDSARKPFVYLNADKPAGLEIEILYMFCKEYGYNVNISDISFASELADANFDIACGGLYITEESKESMNFSQPYMAAEVLMAKYERTEFESFKLSLRESFEKTFVREDRWKLIAEGVCTTLIISTFSVLGGTALGFGLYMLARSKVNFVSRCAKIFAKVYSTIISGTPTLVVLMILFYLVFTSPDMSGVVVAIVGFVLTFGSFVYEQLTVTVSAVDNGQKEAAYALGYSRNQTFFRIILPQSMKMFLPTYSGEIVGLIKATSVVGYIAVNDLTKMGDIIRGNTYEAFFPLIAVAVIYFAIIWCVAGLLGILKRKAEPKRRKNENILKGVVR